MLMQAMERPSQLQYDKNWDAAIDLTLRRFVYGSLSGAASALLLFRSPTTRWAAVAFGAGAGIGSAFTDSSRLFQNSIGGNLPFISSPSSSPAIVGDVQSSSVNPVPEPPKHIEAPKLERFEEPLVQEAQNS
ncbi:MICOS complex subunit MIC10 isoform X1 [Physcomitrium patens]|uniref:MICOS complex subunit MIC10 isoform X1 n=1 Tax=Physcomitrium patens TaxID=3218 RepID=UPI000D1530A6|nr:uncharacterized protein LOC112283828 isoform X1 [Physcomitrium patens]|eukprot:XP_024378821.1 uncharacterized protein LOC112283828 isoform X1 [Physcomitrella patens]